MTTITAISQDHCFPTTGTVVPAGVFSSLNLGPLKIAALFFSLVKSLAHENSYLTQKKQDRIDGN